MRKAGGIVAIIAGSLGLIVAVSGFFLGGFMENIDMEEVDAVLEQEGTSLQEMVDERGGDDVEVTDEMLDELGETIQQGFWMGLVFSAAAIAIGIFAVRANNWMPGAILIVCSVLGIFFAGGFVQYMMWVAALGGILALFPIKTEEPAVSEE
ncbi:MAG: DUF4064 domain-containing protein [Gammaproteobacteria bacterium]|nr:DUF4064 domain-containing protein [Gammaproteobacteria bacterium]